MNKIIAIARAEFLQAVRSKGFLIGLVQAGVSYFVLS